MQACNNLALIFFDSLLHSYAEHCVVSSLALISQYLQNVLRFIEIRSSDWSRVSSHCIDLHFSDHLHFKYFKG